MDDDLERMVEDIRRTIKAVERAHKRAQALQEAPSTEQLHAYRNEIRVLLEELKKADYIVRHEVEVLAEDVVDLVHQALSGHKAAYRHSPPPTSAQGETPRPKQHP